MSFAHSTLSRFGKFFWSSFTGTIVDTIVLWILASTVFETYVGQYVVAPAISFEAAVINNYILSYFWIWRERVQRTRRDFVLRFFVYNLNCVLVFGLKLLLLLVVSWLTGLHVVICNLIALSVTGLVNFSLQHNIIFKPLSIRSFSKES